MTLQAARVRLAVSRLARFISRKPLPIIKTSYEIVTPESASCGDVDSRGWIDETGEAFEPDAYDTAEGKTRVDLAIEYLREKNAEPSASYYHSGVWYTEYQSNDGTREYYETGAEENRSYHLAGFTEREQAAIFEGVTHV